MTRSRRSAARRIAPLPGRDAVRVVVVALLAAGPWAAAAARGECDEVQELLASDGAAGDRFGGAVGLDGSVAVLGASADDDNGNSSGSAYVFRFNGASWQQEQKLLPSDGAAGDQFGEWVTIRDDVAMVGARFDDDNGDNSGSVYVFRFDGASWQQEQKLLAADGAAGDFFGGSFGVSGEVAVVGAWRDDDNGSNSGSAYVFRFDGASWQQEQKLLADDGTVDDSFGADVALSGVVAVVGASNDDDNGSNSGSAYVFRFDGTSWQQEQKLLPSDGAAGDFFGAPVAVSDEVIVVGASSDDDNGSDSGSAYVFRFDGTSWQQERKLLSSDGAASDFFGSDLAVSDEGVVVGALFHDHFADSDGAAYVFQCAAPCPWDCGDGDGTVGVLDFWPCSENGARRAAPATSTARASA